jgi:hypothetical protein
MHQNPGKHAIVFTIPQGFHETGLRPGNDEEKEDTVKVFVKNSPIHIIFFLS